MIKPLLPFCAFLLSSLAVTAQVPVTPAWNYSVIDQRAGTAGLFVLETGNGPEIFCSSEAGASVWLAIKHVPATGGYQIVHVSDPVSKSELREFQAVQVTGDATPELILAHADGTVAIYDATTRALLSKVRPRQGITGFLASDLDADGIPELIYWTVSELIVFDLQGTEKWRLSGAGGFKMVVSQMDGDPALEIATSNRQVIDTGTRTVQWQLPAGGFSSWYPLVTADIDADGMDELIVAGDGDEVVAYDIDLQSEKWNVRIGSSYNHAVLADVDGDPELELLTAGSSGVTKAFELSSSGISEKWRVSNPDGPSLRNTVGQLDDDAELELVRTSRNPDTWGARIRVAGIPSLQEEWVSPPLRGPFVGLCKGDVSGDGIPDYVFGSAQSGGEKGGRIQVVDSNTLHLTGFSGPVVDAGAGAEIHDVNLCDVDGDGRFEIAVTGDAESGGAVGFAEIYRFDPVQGFLRIWSTPPGFSLASGRRIEVLDVDGDGDLEIVVAGQGYDETWQSGVLVFDLETSEEQWRSSGIPAALWPGSGAISLAVSDVDEDGRIEAVFGKAGAGFEVLDLGLGSAEQHVLSPSLTCIATRAGQPGILVGASDGRVARYTKNPSGTYGGGVPITFAAAKSIQQVIPAFGDRWLTVVQDGIRLHQANGQVTWQTAVVSGPLSQRLSPLRTVDGWELFTNTAFGGSGFPLPAMDGRMVVDVIASGKLRESDPAEATIIVTRHQSGPFKLPVRFFLSGTATAGADFQVVGAAQAEDGSWQTEIPAGADSATVYLTIDDDALAEKAESIDLMLAEGTGYTTGPDHRASLRIADNEPVVGVSFSPPSIREVPSVKKAAGTELVFRREGDLSGPLTVSFTTEGTATLGTDIIGLATSSVTFDPGSDRVAFKLVAGRDGVAEGDESLVVSLSPAVGYRLNERAGVAELTIQDLASSVQIVQALPTAKGANLIVRRSVPVDLAQRVEILELRTYPDGSTKSLLRKVAFPKGRYENTLRIAGGKADVRIEWSLVDDGTFFPIGPATLSYDWSPGS
jgi:hypothetical protein